MCFLASSLRNHSRYVDVSKMWKVMIHVRPPASCLRRRVRLLPHVVLSVLFGKTLYEMIQKWTYVTNA
jgi:hypothetical protein